MKVTYIPRNRTLQKRRVAAYCRVSTGRPEQEESFETQVRYYTEQIKEREEWEFAGVFADEGMTGTSAEIRPEFQRMIEQSAAGKLDLVLVKSISRFSRNVVDCQRYAQKLRGYGTEVFFEKERISTFDTSSDMIFALMGAIAQDESRSISENVKWGYRQRYARGEYKLGRNRILGYDVDEKGRLIANQDAWIIRRIFGLFTEGMSCQQISDSIAAMGGHRLYSDKPLAPANISYILRNETYAGDKLLQKQAPRNFLTKKPDPNIPYQSYYLQNDHEAIIDRDTWNKTQEILRRRRTDADAGIHRKAGQHVLYGILFCGECGNPYIRRTRRKAGQDGRRDSVCKIWCCRERFRGNGCRNVMVKEEEILRILTGKLEGTEGNEEYADEERIREYVKRADICGNGEVRVVRRRLG